MLRSQEKKASHKLMGLSRKHNKLAKRLQNKIARQEFKRWIQRQKYMGALAV